MSCELPDAEQLRAYLKNCDTPPKLREIARHFGVPPRARAALRALLHQTATQTASDAPHNNKDHNAALSQELSLIDIVTVDSEGTGHARLSGLGNETAADILILPAGKNRRALKAGRRCLARISQQDDALYAQIMRVLPQQKSRFFGRVYRNRHGTGWMAEPAQKGHNRPVAVLPAGSDGLREGDIIEAELIRSQRHQMSAQILRTLGPDGSPQALIALAVAEFDLPNLFSRQMREQAEQATIPELGTREDIRHLPLVTIDGDDAKDFDDAVHAIPASDGCWQLTVAIADVAHYVQLDSPLDREARRRGNSVYLPGHVIPMIPEALSNGLCSLRPNEDRACLAVEIIIDGQGKKLRHRFFRGLMRSAARLRYQQLQDFMEALVQERDLNLAPGTLYHLVSVYQLLRQQRDERGALNLDLAERKIITDAHGRPEHVALIHQLPAHQLIEEMMVLANVCAAQTLEEKRTLCMFRIHEQPDPEKMDVLRELATTINISLPRGERVTQKRFNQIIAAAKGKGIETAIQDAILRCQARAIYSPANAGHYGLGLSRYAHFTSPIRRYADLMVHRALISALHLGPETAQTSLSAAEETAMHISQSEQTAAKAERRTVARIAAGLISHLAGTTVDVSVTGVTQAGLFARIDGDLAEGFVARRSLPDDYYQTDSAQTCLYGLHNGWHFTIGDKLRCRIDSISQISGDVTLSWQEGGGQKKAKYGGKAGQRDRKKTAGKRNS